MKPPNGGEEFVDRVGTAPALAFVGAWQGSIPATSIEIEIIAGVFSSGWKYCTVLYTAKSSEKEPRSESRRIERRGEGELFLRLEACHLALSQARA